MYSAQKSPKSGTPTNIVRSLSTQILFCQQFLVDGAVQNLRKAVLILKSICPIYTANFYG